MPRIVVRRNSNQGGPDGARGSARVSAEGAAKGLRRRSSRLSRVSDDSAVGLTTQLPTSSRTRGLRGSKSFAESQVSQQLNSEALILTPIVAMVSGGSLLKHLETTQKQQQPQNFSTMRRS